MRFDHAYVQSGVCGPARMSYYTGRYVSSHGATWNRVPLSAAEYTLGDYLHAAGRTATLAGKTHVLPDNEALERFGIEIESERGALLREGGFTVVDRYDGHTPPGPRVGIRGLAARAWLRRRRSVERARDRRRSTAAASPPAGRCATCTCRRASPSAHSETAYMTDLALDWIRAQGDTPWVLHLSYVKPHWPYVAPAPFHAMFRNADVGPILHGPQDGTADEHPVVRAYREHDECLSFAQRSGRPPRAARVHGPHRAARRPPRPRARRARRRWAALRDTLIVFTSDHGEFAGDRGLGEKELFYDEIVRVPFIVCDPDPRADATRGSADARFVEGIDVVPTILDALGIAGAPHRVEGRSLLPLTRGDAPAAWRDCRVQRARLRIPPRAAGAGPRRARMPGLHGAHRRTGSTSTGKDSGRSSSISAPIRRSSLDLGADARHDAVRARMRERLFDWIATGKRRTTVTDEVVESAHRCPSRARHPHRHLVRHASRNGVGSARRQLGGDDEHPCG